jgi:ribosomal protein L7/L12
MRRVQLIGWERGFQTISFIKLLRVSGVRSLSLPEAKDLVDQLLASKAQVKELGKYFGASADLFL